MRNFPVIAAAGLLMAFSVRPASAQDALAQRAKGNPAATVTVYEMSDFQCPYCRRFAIETFPELDRDYVKTGKIRWVFVNFPLPRHPNAAPAAEVAMCAGRQGAFWPVHDLLFKYQDTWAPLASPAEFFLSLADSAKIDRKVLGSCLESGAVREEVKSDAQGAVRSGANSTPTFYIEGGLLAGAHPAGVFRPILDSIITARSKK
ncbi:MAG TPA: thioredoxin domain-containing protein [Gemmatimonadales bacterium]|nr:thioredoxin domain-containing protein [Gemmatimonadales bacterium]